MKKVNKVIWVDGQNLFVINKAKTASKEMGFKTNCAKCGLCSGTEGKGKKDIKILEH
jgi:hypothetical protein